MDVDAVLAEKLATIRPRLNEKQRCLVGYDNDSCILGPFVTDCVPRGLSRLQP
jgi:hypothetical protein